MKKWEYIFLNYVGEETWVELQEKFTELGEKGWELITYARATSEMVIFFILMLQK